jgi:GAF domain-containing protein/HAMP domain-containing protein
MALFKLKSVEKPSLIRKFSVLFSLMSFFPFMVLATLLFYFYIKGTIRLNLNLLYWLLLLVGVFALIGFFSMRHSLTKLIKISKGAQEIFKGNIPKRIDIKTTGDTEVAQIARAFNEMVGKLELNIQELQKSKGALQNVLSKIATGASSTENINTFLDLILETAVKAVDAKSGLLLLFEEGENELVVKSTFGLAASFYARDKRIPMEREVIGWAVRQKEPLLIPRLHKITTAAGADSVFQPPLICTPLIFQNRVVGVISISGKEKDANFREEELAMLSDLASQIALAVENAKLNADAQKTYLETITALALAVEARDHYSRGHSDRVSKYAGMIAKELGLDKERVRKIKEAAQLHDVGKIGISDEILRKPDALNNYEKEIIQQHPIIGEGIIMPLHGFSHLRDPIRHHHEWLNGKGYPDHLKGNEISLEAKILAVADAFDAMRTDRPYRKGLDLTQAKQELLKYKGVYYDAEVIDAFMKCV